MVTFGLLVVGGVNWLLTAFDYNVVNLLLGSWPSVETIVYVLVGVSAIYEVVMHSKTCKMCNAGDKMQGNMPSGM